MNAYSRLLQFAIGVTTLITVTAVGQPASMPVAALSENTVVPVGNTPIGVSFSPDGSVA